MTINEQIQKRFIKENEDNKLINFDNLKPKFMYYRNEKNQRIGMVVAFAPGFIGWTKWNNKNKFNLTFALKVALGRAIINHYRGDTQIQKESIRYWPEKKDKEKIRDICPLFLKNLYIHMKETSFQ